MTMYCPYCGTPVSDRLLERHEGLYSLWELKLTCPSSACRTIVNIIDFGTASIEEIVKLLDNGDPVISRRLEHNKEASE